MNKRSGEKSRSRILSAARKVFAEQGYAQANMRSIARKAGISVGGVYLYFRGKEELYRTLMIDWKAELNEMTVAALRDIDDPRDAIGTFISITLDSAKNHREMILMLGRELGFSFGIDDKQRFFLERRTIIKDLIDRGVAAGVFAPCNTDETAKIVFNTLRGFVLSMVIDEDALFSTEECINLILNGLVRRDNQ